jgi:lysyl endopeptidase
MQTNLNHGAEGFGFRFAKSLFKRTALNALTAIGLTAAFFTGTVHAAGDKADKVDKTTTQASTASARAPSVVGEYAKALADEAKSKAALVFRGSKSMQANSSELTFKAMDSKRVESAVADNAKPGKKSLQVGINRAVADEATDAKAGAPKLKWQVLTDGGQVAYMRIASPSAKALRTGLRLKDAPLGTTLRFVGVTADSKSTTDGAVATATATADLNEVTTLADATGIYWSPVTEGAVQLIEIHVPAGAEKLSATSLAVESVSHFFASAADKFKAAKAGSGFCEVDVGCAAQTQGFVNAKNSVAHMIFTIASLGKTFVCTGTLLNDNDTSTNIPYFFSANHCFDDDSAVPNYQAVANTLTTYWFYENPRCGPPDLDISQSVQVTGGATVLYNDRGSDVLFTRLNRQPPAGAWYAGWDSAPLDVNSPTTIIHHPEGDVKKVTLGQVLRYENNIIPGRLTGSYIVNGYSRGVTEAGSSGSGLFTVDGAGNYQLRGGLFGGPSGCSGNINNPFGTNNFDFYSRFDLAYPAIRPYLFGGTSGPANYTDLWWAGTIEDGWGMSVTQHGSTQFIALYIYDNVGQPLWVVVPGGAWNANFTTYSGAVYGPTSSPYYAYDANQFRANAPLGNVAVTYTSIGTAVLDYNINGISGRKSIERQPFGQPDNSPGLVVGDLWWGGASQNGWGVNMTQHDRTVFGIWYTYGADGRPTWFAMPGAWSGNTLSGLLYRTSSSAWLGVNYDKNQFRATVAGDFSFNFSGNSNATMTYTVNGVTSQSKQIARQPF